MSSLQLRCYDVLCAEGCRRYRVGVIAESMAKAYKVAEKSLLEGRHIKATAINADIVDKI